MKGKRGAETDLLIDIQKIIGAELSYEGVTLARYIESRETELRRQIADELTEHIERYKTPRAQIASIQANVIEKLRGEK